MNIKSLPLIVLTLAAAVAPQVVEAQRIILFEDDYYRGEQLVVDGPVSDLNANRWNDKASSLRIESGDWEVCKDVNFRGCVRVEQTTITSLGNQMRLNDAISSLRPITPAGSLPGVAQQQAISGSSDGHGVRLGDRNPLLLRSMRADFNPNGTFAIQAGGETDVQLGGTWRSVSEGLVEVKVNNFNGSAVTGSGRVEVGAGRVRRAIVAGEGWRVSFTGGRGGSSTQGGQRVTCESIDDGFTFCPAETNGAVSIERRLGGTNCTYNRTWSWNRDGVWVDAGCRGEFLLGRSAQGGGSVRPR